MFGRLSLPVGGARRSPAAAPESRSRPAGGGGAPVVARSDERPQWWPRRPRRRSVVPAGAQRRARWCQKRCCYTLAYSVCWRSPATASLCSRRMRSKLSVIKRIRCVARYKSPKSARRRHSSTRLFAPGPNHRARRTPLTAHASTQQSCEPTGSCALIEEPKSTAARRHPHRNLQKPPPPPPRRL